MRTYCSLIRYEADFRLATDLAQIPRIPPATDAKTPNSSKCEQRPGDYRVTPLDEGSGGGYRITYEGFVEFIAQFAPARVPDAPRYRFGELALHFRDDFPRRLFLEPVEQEEQHSSSKHVVKKKQKGKKPTAPEIFATCGFWSLTFGIPVVCAWDGAPWALHSLPCLVLLLSFHGVLIRPSCAS